MRQLEGIEYRLHHFTQHIFWGILESFGRWQYGIGKFIDSTKQCDAADKLR